MLIVCPSCASEYVIDPARIGEDGRTVRCAACRTTWPVDGTAPRAAVVPEQTSTPPAKRARPRGPQRPGVRSGAMSRTAVPIAVCAIFVVALLAAVALRVPFVRAVPGAASLFAAVGLPVNVTGLRLAAVSSGLSQEAAKPVLVVTGEIGNVTNGIVAVPSVDIAIESEDGEPLYNWSTRPPRSELGPGESMTFGARLASPPPLGRRILVTFAPAPGEAAVASR